MPGRKLCQRGAPPLRLPLPLPLLARGVAAGLVFCVRRAGAAATSASATSASSVLAVLLSGQLPLPSGMAGGQSLLDGFLQRIDDYGDTRNLPAVKGPSYLGVHLRFGTVSIRRLVRAARQRSSAGAATWLKELVWREFYFQVLANFPQVAAGQSFRDFLKGELPAYPGHKPTVDDWADHLSTAFPEVRLKTFLEMRGADGGRWGRICALPAFWVGLLYDQGALDAAWDLVKGWSMEGREELRSAVPRLALDAPLPGGGKLKDIAGQVLDIAAAGLNARARLNASGDNESGFLDPLREVVRTGKVPAQVLLDRFNGDWGGDIRRVYEEARF